MYKQALTVLGLNSKYKMINVFSIYVPCDLDFSISAIYSERILHVSTHNTVRYPAVRALVCIYCLNLNKPNSCY